MGHYPPLSTVAQRQLLARITSLMQEKKFHVTQVRAQGPRYFLASGIYHKRRAIFKMCVRPKSHDRLTNEKLGREFVFLQTVEQSRSPLSRALPHVWQGATTPHAWYIREEVRGTSAMLPGNETKYRESFFTQKNMCHLDEIIGALQRQTIRHFPRSFRNMLYPPQRPSYLWRFIAPYHRQVDQFMHELGFTARCHAFFKTADAIVRRAPRVLAHQELYPPHFLHTGGQWKIIDWENIGWALPTYDYVTIWLRAYAHPDWQASWRARYEYRHQKYADAGRLWDTTVFIQSLFNVVGYHFYPHPHRFAHLAHAAAKQLRNHQKNASL